MSLNYTYGGPNSVPEYQVSAVPWVTSSVLTTSVTEIQFPQVTRFISVYNFGGPAVKVGFTRNGVNGSGTNYYMLPTSASFSGDFRVKSLFIAGSGNTINVVAGLTMINTRDFPVITGSNGFLGVG